MSRYSKPTLAKAAIAALACFPLAACATSHAAGSAALMDASARGCMPKPRCHGPIMPGRMMRGGSGRCGRDNRCDPRAGAALAPLRFAGRCAGGGGGGAGNAVATLSPCAMPTLGVTSHTKIPAATSAAPRLANFTPCRNETAQIGMPPGNVPSPRSNATRIRR